MSVRMPFKAVLVEGGKEVKSISFYTRAATLGFVHGHNEKPVANRGLDGEKSYGTWYAMMRVPNEDVWQDIG